MARKKTCSKLYRFEQELADKIDAKAEELNINKNTLVVEILTKALKNVKVKRDKNT